MKIFPAIDIKDKKCVRLVKGDFDNKTEYEMSPVEQAGKYKDHGFKNLHIVDLDGAKSKQIINHKILESIATHTNLKIDFGGGLKSDKDVEIAFECGANQITGGSIAVKSPALFESWLSKYGSDKIILGADFKNRKIATSGWLETSELDLIDFIKQYEQKGISQVICTDISKDGMLQGTSNELYSEIIAQTNIKLIASGGVSNIDDLILLKEMEKDGLLQVYSNKIKVTKKGQPFVRNICMAFDVLLQRKQPDTPLFSMTV